MPQSITIIHGHPDAGKTHWLHAQDAHEAGHPPGPCHAGWHGGGNVCHNAGALVR